MAIQNIASEKLRKGLKTTGVQSPLQNKQAIASGATSDVPTQVLGGRSYEEETVGINRRDPKKLNPKQVGWIHSDGMKLADEYKIKITSRGSSPPVMVVGAMQEKTGFRITSDWEPFVPIGGLTQLANATTQFVSGRALVSRFSSRRSWKGTTPVTINLELKFESVEHTHRNVVAPVLALMQMALPGAGVLLKPPGPDPFRLPEKVKSAIRTAGEVSADLLSTVGIKSTGLKNMQFRDERSGGDWITVEIGKYLKFESVIVKSVNPVFDTKMSTDGGYPISANVGVEIETYEILTKESLYSSFKTKG